MTRLAIDIGGANLKAADGTGYACSHPFALWRAPGELAARLQSLLAAAPPCEALAVTMTGELCDCFATRAAGVVAIIDAVEDAGAGRPVEIYLTDGRMAPADVARELPHLAAASNWHALATFAARFLHGGSGLLFDVGSTTADLIPVVNGVPDAVGRTDEQRMLAGELVYTGVGRTPVASVVSHLPWRGRWRPVASELFATTADAYVTLGDVPEDNQCHDTADGRARTVELSRSRLARMFCVDATTFDDSDAWRAAMAIRDRQLLQLEGGLGQVIARLRHAPETVIVSGQGEFLARAAVEQFARGGRTPNILSLSSHLGAEASRCAPAHALAVLANERHSSIAGVALEGRDQLGPRQQFQPTRGRRANA